MAERVQSDKPRVLDPNFAIPEGVTNFTYKELTDGDESALEVRSNDEAPVSDISVEDSELDGESDDTPDTPFIYGIVSQVIRTAPDGSQVVDVVLDVDDIDSTEEYNVRITAT